jgi:hypothetical protein
MNEDHSQIKTFLYEFRFTYDDHACASMATFYAGCFHVLPKVLKQWTLKALTDL